MFSKLVVVSLVAALFCTIAAAQEPVPIVSQTSDVQPDGNFQWSFESGDGTSQEQHGVPKPVDKEVAEVVQGSASWTDPEGVKHQFSYTADENGYQPTGADVPLVPSHVARALEYNLAHPEPTEH